LIEVYRVVFQCTIYLVSRMKKRVDYLLVRILQLVKQHCFLEIKAMIT